MFRRLLVVPGLLLAAGCSDDVPQKSLHGQRNLACLHSQRDTDEGYEAAIAILEKVVQSDQVVFEDWLNLARAIVLHAKRVEGARQAVDKARALGSDAAGLAALDYVEGLLLKAKQSYAKAHDLFQRVLDARPDHPEALYQCGYTAELAGQFSEAKRRYERLIEIGKLVRPAAYRLSKTAAKLKDDATVQKAIATFNARPKDEKPETTKCDLTDLDMRRFGRDEVEPLRVELTWKDVETISAPAAIRSVVPCPGAKAGTADLFLLGGGPGSGKAWVRAGNAAPAELANNLTGEASAVVIDVDNKAGHEVVIADDAGFRTFARTGGTWQPMSVKFPERRGDAAPRSMRAFDQDHDGDLDIVLVTGGADPRLQVLRNNGDGGFAWHTPFEAKVRTTGDVVLDAHDLDQANDLDIVVPGSDDAGAVLFLNRRGERYKPIALPALAGRQQFLVEDFDNDGAPDILGTGGKRGFVLLRNADAKGRPYDVSFANPATGDSGLVRNLAPGDIDQDGDLDVLLLTDRGVMVLRNTAGTLLVESTSVPAIASGLDLDLVDIDGDGVLEVLVVTDEGKVRVVRGTGSDFQAVVLAPVGRKDNRDAIGTVAELYADRLFRSAMIKSPFGLRLGLGEGGMNAIDGVRLRWPQGIRQSTPSTVLQKQPGWKARRLTYRQIEGLVASCPFLYTRGEKGWAFQSDVLGIAPLAEWLPPGGKPHLDPEEFVRIPGDQLTVRDGRVELAITEELKETAYLDRVELLYADHPADDELLIDENLTQGAYDELVVHTFPRGTTAAPKSVKVGGVEHASRVAKTDGVYLYSYGDAPSQWGGWTEPHAMDITIAEAANLLILQGRLAWYDSTVSYALYQNGRSFTPVRVEQVLANGQTKLLVEDAGGPTGMDRTLLVPLGDEVLPAGTVLRVTAQYRLHWDRIRTAVQSEKPQPKIGTATLADAQLYHHGYSEYLGDPATHEQRYDFDRRSPDDRYPRARGFSNEYGDVLPLVTEHDDRLVVIIAGDAVKIGFRAQPVPSGMQRTWFLRISGWAKESSFHNLTGEEIAPLPFRGMTRYPPPPGEQTSWTDAAKTLTRRVR